MMFLVAVGIAAMGWGVEEAQSHTQRERREKEREREKREKREKERENGGGGIRTQVRASNSPRLTSEEGSFLPLTIEGSFELGLEICLAPTRVLVKLLEAITTSPSAR
jgi:hypothetical protein